MAQYVFGDFLFSERDDSPLYSLSCSADGGWIEVELLNRLPMQQQTGRKLDQITLRGLWFGSKGQQSYDKLLTIREEGKPRTLVRSDGTNLGRFTLVSIDFQGDRMVHNGICMVQEIALTLKEFSDPNIKKQERNNASHQNASG